MSVQVCLGDIVGAVPDHRIEVSHATVLVSEYV